MLIKALALSSSLLASYSAAASDVDLKDTTLLCDINKTHELVIKFFEYKKFGFSILDKKRISAISDALLQERDLKYRIDDYLVRLFDSNGGVYWHIDRYDLTLPDYNRDEVVACEQTSIAAINERIKERQKLIKLK